ncbi:MAG: branched-chain amino acid ABC transporter permease [Kiloniellales bacterium]
MLSRVPPAARGGWLVAGVATLLLILAGFTLGNYERYLIVIWLIYSISGLGLNLPIGFGQIYSLGQGGFMLVGAYTTAIVTSTWHLPYAVALIASLVLAVVVGILVGLPAMRLRLFSLAIVTFAFGFMLFHVVKSFQFTGGPQGLFMDPLWLTDAFSGRAIYFFALLVAVLGLLASYSIAHSKSGRALLVVGQNETAARSLGINITYYKLAAFIFASVLGALAGSIHAVLTSYVAPETYAAELSVTMFAAVMIGGKGKLLGPFLGAAFIVGIPEVTQAARGLAEVIYAILFILVVTVSPGGILGILEGLIGRLRRGSIKAATAGERAP